MFVKGKKLFAAVLAVVGCLVAGGMVAASSNAGEAVPTRENPILVDTTGKRVLIYTEVNEMNVHQPNVHWGVVFKDGKFQDRAILKSWANHLAFHDAIVKIGGHAGNNLTKDTIGNHVDGDELDVTALVPGAAREYKLGEVFVDLAGKDFKIKFGGNRPASENMNTGCITCLESCWIAVSSNTSYPQTGSIKRFVNPNSKFKGNPELLPTEGKPVVLVYRVKGRA